MDHKGFPSCYCSLEMQGLCQAGCYLKGLGLGRAGGTLPISGKGWSGAKLALRRGRSQVTSGSPRMQMPPSREHSAAEAAVILSGRVEFLEYLPGLLLGRPVLALVSMFLRSLASAALPLLGSPAWALCWRKSCFTAMGHPAPESRRSAWQDSNEATLGTASLSQGSGCIPGDSTPGPETLWPFLVHMAASSVPPQWMWSQLKAP